MKDEKTTETQDASHGERLPYEKPELVEYGDVQTLTQGQQSGDTDLGPGRKA